MDFLRLEMVPRQSPRRTTVHLHNLLETQGVKKCLRLLGQRAFVGSPCVDFLLDFSVEEGLVEACKNRRCQQKAYFSLETV